MIRRRRIIYWVGLGVVLWFAGRAIYPYPASVQPVVQAASKRTDVDTNLILAVIRTESHFRPRAVSTKGARGLMQIMPATGRWLWPKVYPGTPFKAVALDDPRVNVELGTAYLGILLKSYKGNLSLALAAYNGGGANVRRWIRSKDRTNKTFLATVTFPETKHFVMKVWVAYLMYHVLYPWA